MGKTILLILLLVIFLGAFLLFKSIITQPNKPLLQTPVLRKENHHSLSIKALKQRNYKPQEIKIEENLGNQGSFHSFIVSYSSDGLKIFSIMSIPNQPQPKGGFPVLIINHGYINPESYSTTQSYKRLADYFSSQGYLVLKPDYRGHDSSEREAQDRSNRINYAVDVLNLIHSVENIKQANPKRIYMLGHSMGGEITLRVVEVTDKVKAASLWAPAVTSFPESILYFVKKHRPQILPQLEKEVKDNFRPEDFPQVGSLENVSLVNTPLIIHHGTDDQSVPYLWSIEFDKKLTQERKDHIFYTYPDDDHNFTGNFLKVTQRDLEFFNNNQ